MASRASLTAAMAAVAPVDTSSPVTSRAVTTVAAIVVVFVDTGPVCTVIAANTSILFNMVFMDIAFTWLARELNVACNAVLSVDCKPALFA